MPNRTGRRVASPHLSSWRLYRTAGNIARRADALLIGNELGAPAVTLMGNHERMMLDFLDDPITQGNRWLRHGGCKRLAVFGIGGITETARRDGLCNAAMLCGVRLAAIRLRCWLGCVSAAWWQNGTVAVTPCGGEHLRAAMADQSETAMLGHPILGACHDATAYGSALVTRSSIAYRFSPWRVAVDHGRQQYGDFRVRCVCPDWRDPRARSHSLSFRATKRQFHHSSPNASLLPCFDLRSHSTR